MQNLTDAQITQRILEGESACCEFKREWNSSVKEKVCQTICAFANNIQGDEQVGLIVIGLNDDGSCSEVVLPVDLDETINNLRGEGKIVPLPSFTTRSLNYQGCQLLCIQVIPAISTPIKFDGRIWVRPGNTTRLAGIEDERRLNEKRRLKDQPDDAQVLERFRISDLNLDYFKNSYLPQAFAPDILKSNGRTVEEQLSSTKMLGEGYEGEMHPTVLGLLCLGLSPTDAIPGAYVQFARFAGEDEASAVLDQQEIHGHVVDVIQTVEAKFDAHNRIPIDFLTHAKELQFPEYPKVAFQQLFRNAVMHRSYLGNHTPIRIYWFSDRIRITNPGGPTGMSLQEFGRPGFTAYRNPNLAAVLKDLNFVQRFGAGIGAAKSALKSNQNPELELEPSENFVTVTLRKRI